MLVGAGENFEDGDLAGVRWNISWETADRPDAELYIAVEKPFSHLLAPNPHAGLLSALPSAVKNGEESLSVHEADPVLLEGLEVVQAYYEHWQSLRPMRIRSASVRPMPKLVESRTTAVFFSGGVDSLATLRRNADAFPLGHPGRVTHALHMDLAGPAKIAELGGRHRPEEIGLLRNIAPAPQDLGVHPVSVVTNVRSLDGYDFGVDWMFHAHGTVLAAIAHAFEPAFYRVLIASSYDIAHLSPWGSHPLIDGRLSSSTFEITHHNEQFSRQKKIDIIADWDAALSAMDVCYNWFDRAAGGRNCGRCEKCQRTIAGLTVAGVNAASTGAFVEAHLDAHTLSRVGVFTDDYERDAWRELHQRFRAAGNPEASSIGRVLSRDSAAKLLDNRFGRPALRMAKRGYKKLKRLS